MSLVPAAAEKNIRSVMVNNGDYLSRGGGIGRHASLRS